MSKKEPRISLEEFTGKRLRERRRACGQQPSSFAKLAGLKGGTPYLHKVEEGTTPGAKNFVGIYNALLELEAKAGERISLKKYTGKRLRERRRACGQQPSSFAKLAGLKGGTPYLHKVEEGTTPLAKNFVGIYNALLDLEAMATE